MSVQVPYLETYQRSSQGWPVVGNAPELASSDGNLIPIFNRWAKIYGDIVQFSILGEKQIVLSSDRIAHELFVKRGPKYSDRGTPHAMAYITRDLNPALMPKNGTFNSIFLTLSLLIPHQRLGGESEN